MLRTNASRPPGPRGARLLTYHWMFCAPFDGDYNDESIIPRATLLLRWPFSWGKVKARPIGAHLDVRRGQSVAVYDMVRPAHPLTRRESKPVEEHRFGSLSGPWPQGVV